MNKWIEGIAKLGLKVAEQTIPAVHVIEEAVPAFKNAATGEDKLAALEKAVIEGGLPTAEFVADKDLLNDNKVRAAWRGFVAAYVTFQNALRDAKAARVPPTSASSSAG